MTKDNAKDFLPLVQALAEGKTIQLLYDNGIWENLKDVSFNTDIENYRIKPEPEYVPFDTVEELIECWGKYSSLTMPLIWIKHKETDNKHLITDYYKDNTISTSDEIFSLRVLFEHFTFLDGSPIGKIKE